MVLFFCVELYNLVTLGVEICELWLQNQVARGKIEVLRVRGEDNFSDSLTEHSSSDRIMQTMMATNQ